MLVTNHDLLAYFRTRACEVCGTAHAEPHHIKARGIAGGSRLDVTLNLIAVCRPCHDAIHAGKVSHTRLFDIVAEREGLEDGGVVQAAIWRLLRERR